MKKKSLLTGLSCLPLALIFCFAAIKLFADDTNQPATAGTVDLAQQAQDTLSQASSQQDYEHAADLFEKACLAQPENYDIRLTLGWLYLDKLHLPGVAYPHLRAVVKHRPDNVDARKLLGMACTQTGRTGEAVTQFRAAAKLKPDDLWIQASLGRALARYGEYGAADKIYDNVLRSDPNNADARLGKAELAAWRGQSEKALKILDQLLQENPANVEALLLVADIHRWQWKLTESRADYQRVLTIDTNNAAALSGIKEANRMGASNVGGNFYIFKDTAHYQRESVGVSTRDYLADPLYLLAGVDGWRFFQPGVGNEDRLDANLGLEYHPARWLELSGSGDYFDYEHKIDISHQDGFFGGQLSAKLTPMTGLDIYTIVAGNQPFISSMSTVTNALKQHSIGNGIDWKIIGPLSFQNSIEAARVSDNNSWVEEKPQLSLNVLKVPDTYLRVQYDYLDYSRINTNYWTPKAWHIIWPVFDTSIPLCKNVHVDVDARAPYVVNENRFGYVVEAGPTIDLFNHLQVKASYYRSTVPGSQGQWSGQGGQASLTLRF